MPNPRELTEVERQQLWADAQAEFPHDEMMRDIHFVRALHAAQLEGVTRDQRIAYYNRTLPPQSSSPGGRSSGGRWGK